MKQHLLTATVAFSLFCASPTAALAAASVSPQSARPGDSFKLIATTDCVNGTAKQPLNKDSVTISGSDVTLTFVDSNGCSAWYTAVVSSKPINRELVINLASNGTPLGTFAFQITDIPPGPIPPGLDPQVDVMWTIMSERTCADQFGVRVARHYFCLNVTIGNNSGYPLIVASMGFLRRDGTLEYRDTTASYLSVRATVQQEHIFSARNLTLRALQNAGVIIAGFAPFAGNAGRKGRIGIWAALTGTVASAWDNLIPDRTIAQAANLDDATLRDGRLIPNNSPVRFAVFVDREELKPILLESAKQLEDNANLADQVASGMTDRAGATAEPARRAQIAQQAEKWREHARVLREEAPKRNAKTTKATKSKFDPLARNKAPLEDDLLAVRRALGSLIIVGDQIQYLQRVQVDASAVVPEIMPVPEVRSSTPSAVPNQSLDIVLQGKWLAKATVTALKCDAKFTVVPDSTGNSLTLKGFTLQDCPESAIPLVINNGGGSLVYNLPVAQKPALDKPENDTVAIDSNGKVTLALTGKFLTGAKPKITLSNGTGNQDVAADKPPEVTETGLKLTFTVPDAYKKAGTTATVTVSTAAGNSETVTFKLALAQKPVLDQPNAAVVINAKQAVFALTGKSLTGAKPTIVLKNTAGRSTTIQSADKDLKVSKASATGLTVTLSNIDSAYVAADSTATISVKTDAGESDPVDFKFQKPPAAKKAAKK